MHAECAAAAPLDPPLAERSFAAEYYQSHGLAANLRAEWHSALRTHLHRPDIILGRPVDQLVERIDPRLHRPLTHHEIRRHRPLRDVHLAHGEQLAERIPL